MESSLELRSRPGLFDLCNVHCFLKTKMLCERGAGVFSRKRLYVNRL